RRHAGPVGALAADELALDEDDPGLRRDAAQRGAERLTGRSAAEHDDVRARQRRRIPHREPDSRPRPAGSRSCPASIHRPMPEILVVCPQERDRREIRAAGLDESYGVRFAGPDLHAVEFFDPPAFPEGAAAEPVDGVIGTKDRSALLAALIAERRGLASPSPQALLACQ